MTHEILLKQMYLEDIINRLEDVMSLIDKINDDETMEKLYIKTRNLKEEFEYKFDK